MAIEHGHTREFAVIVVAHQTVAGAMLIEPSDRYTATVASGDDPHLARLPANHALSQQTLQEVFYFPPYRSCDTLLSRATHAAPELMLLAKCYIIGTDPLILAFPAKASHANRDHANLLLQRETRYRPASFSLEVSTRRFPSFVAIERDLTVEIDRVAIFSRWKQTTIENRYDDGEFVAGNIRYVELTVAKSLTELIYAPSFDETLRRETR